MKQQQQNKPKNPYINLHQILHPQIIQTNNNINEITQSKNEENVIASDDISNTNIASDNIGHTILPTKPILLIRKFLPAFDEDTYESMDSAVDLMYPYLMTLGFLILFNFVAVPFSKVSNKWFPTILTFYKEGFRV